jgi:hypothetical protein
LDKIMRKIKEVGAPLRDRVPKEHIMSSSDDTFGEGPEPDAATDEFDRHIQAIHDFMQDYMDKHDIPEAAGADLLLSVALNMRMVGYALYVEKPSAGGLKLDLDRFRGEIDLALRHAKREAGEFIERIKPLLAAAKLDNDNNEEGGET